MKPTIIEGVVEHKCGWISDGGAFPEGAGCPKCGEPIGKKECRSPETDGEDAGEGDGNA